MRIRFGLRLPGPFVLTAGRPRRGPGCGWLLFGLLWLAGITFADPWAGVVLLVLFGLLLWAANRERNRQ